jgi:two-component system OmpR family response regulator
MSCREARCAFNPRHVSGICLAAAILYGFVSIARKRGFRCNVRAMTTPTTAPRILIVDDDADIRILLADYLGEQGWHVSTAQDGNTMRQVLDSTPIDLVVLDLTLPGDDGLTLCRDLRARSSIPVIMLTARSAPLDRILGLEMGADDYLCKPFEPRELLVRIRNVLRRSQGTVTEYSATPARWHFADWTLDDATRQLQNSVGLVVALSGGEYRLLKALLERPNRALSRDQLLTLTQGRETDPLDRSIDLHISRLRQKLGDDARAPQLIKTLRNEGYLLAASVKRSA